VEEEMTKSEFLALIQSEFTRFADALANIPDDILTTRPVVEWWTLKDVIGHITTWEQESLESLEHLRQHGQIKLLGLVSDDDVSRYNKRAAAFKRDWPLARLRADFEATHRALVAAIENLSDAQLQTQLPAPFPEGFTLEKYLASDTWEHYREHAGQIEK
jgi:hypothetical protein